MGDVSRDPTQQLPAAAQDDLRRLADVLGEHAAVQVDRGRTMIPVAAGFDVDGQWHFFIADLEQVTDDKSAEEALAQELAGRRDELRLRAVCLVADTKNSELGDTLEFHFDFAETVHGIVALRPYQPGGFLRRARFGQTHIAAGPHFVFGL
ncbi:hypothetical protein [Buchananella hordeovulneris]|uniref:hypothetical protein n=1 Tax=Buchananella hordeovulneris TaxID=52770 RepID=UPI0026DCFD0D|nr:hypothetical protein [Buchananella hordeovulneris]MDO5080147.1 hypothetical protein [Buchananella hordeovulneris]